MPQVNFNLKTVGTFATIIALLFTIGTYVATQSKASGEYKQKVDILDQNFKTHAAWAERRNEALTQTEIDIAAIKVMLEQMQDDLKEIKRNTRKR